MNSTSRRHRNRQGRALAFTLVACLASIGALPTHALAAAPEQVTETIQLKHRSAASVLSLIHPFLETGARVSGDGNRLEIKASPANIAQLRDVLTSVDREPVRLRLTIRDVRASGNAKVLGERKATIEEGRLMAVTSPKEAKFDVLAQLRGGVATLEIRRSHRAFAVLAGPSGQWFELSGAHPRASGVKTLVKLDPAD